jgi:hypothetical protein
MSTTEGYDRGVSTAEGYNRGLSCPLQKVITEVYHVHYRRLQQRCVMSTNEGYNRGVSCPLMKVLCSNLL